MRRVLILSYDFPPSPVGIWRTLKFCRYMPEFGWQPAVLTVKPMRAPRYDMAPMSELPPETEVRRTGSLDPARLAYLYSQLRNGPPAERKAMPSASPSERSIMQLLRRWFFLPDERMLWLPFAVQGGKRWLRETKFDALYSTSFPHTAHVAGAVLAKRFRIPWLADFRDSWTGNYEFFRPATPLHGAIQHRLERLVVEHAQCVVTATEPITRDFQDRYPDQKFRTITNGFDDSDYPTIHPEPDREHFTLSYVGTLFGEASPKQLFQAIRRLLRREPKWRNVLRLQFVGSIVEKYRAMIARAGIEDITRVEGYMPHGEALRVMAEADALLLLVPDVPGSEIMLTQKIFEYAAAGRPILGLVPRGAAGDFLAETNTGRVVHPNDVPRIEAVLREMLIEWQRHGRTETAPIGLLQKYHRRNLTEVLCRELDQISK